MSSLEKTRRKKAEEQQEENSEIIMVRPSGYSSGSGYTTVGPLWTGWTGKKNRIPSFHIAHRPDNYVIDSAGNSVECTFID